MNWIPDCANFLVLNKNAFFSIMSAKSKWTRDWDVWMRKKETIFKTKWFFDSFLNHKKGHLFQVMYWRTIESRMNGRLAVWMNEQWVTNFIMGSLTIISNATLGQVISLKPSSFWFKAVKENIYKLELFSVLFLFG